MNRIAQSLHSEAARLEYGHTRLFIGTAGDDVLAVCRGKDRKYRAFLYVLAITEVYEGDELGEAQTLGAAKAMCYVARPGCSLDRCEE